MAEWWQIDETRTLELLADRAVFGLSENEQQELEELLSRVGWLAVDSIETVAAVIQLTYIADHLEPLPVSISPRTQVSRAACYATSGVEPGRALSLR